MTFVDFLIELARNPGSNPRAPDGTDKDEMQRRCWIVEFGNGYKLTKAAAAFLSSNKIKV